MTENNLPPSTPPAAPAVTSRQTSVLAIASLVSGLLGWTLVPFLGSLAAVITGHLARAEIRRNPDTLDGDGMAIAGLVLGYVVIALSLLGLLAILFIFGGLAVFLGALGMSGQG